MIDIPHHRLISRKPVWSLDPYPSNRHFSISEAWMTLWLENSPVNGDLILDPNMRPPGFDLPRHKWVLLNRFRTNNGRCAYQMNSWGFRETANCDCGAIQQTMQHIVNECLLRSFPGGLIQLNDVDPTAVEYLSNLDLKTCEVF
jgi:hypothetical protein